MARMSSLTSGSSATRLQREPVMGVGPSIDLVQRDRGAQSVDAPGQGETGGAGTPLDVDAVAEGTAEAVQGGRGDAEDARTSELGCGPARVR